MFVRSNGTKTKIVQSLKNHAPTKRSERKSPKNDSPDFFVVFFSPKFYESKRTKAPGCSTRLDSTLLGLNRRKKDESFCQIKKCMQACQRNSILSFSIFWLLKVAPGANFWLNQHPPQYFKSIFRTACDAFYLLWFISHTN